MRESEYKYWFDDDGITFHSQHKVLFSQSAGNKALSFCELLKITSDMAVEDYAEQGMSRDFLKENGFAFLVSRASFRFHRMPRENERFTFTTWEEKPEAFQLVRAYEFTAEDGTPLISGLSSWILADPVARRIIPTKNFTLRPPVEIQKEHDCQKYGKIAMPENLQLLDERKIRWSDIDGNGHTNNSRYGAFLADALPEAYRTKTFTDFRINYAKEAMLGETMQLLGSFDEDARRAVIIGKVVRDAAGNDTNSVSFESELKW
ncbi:MAG: acyl-[acyl-carrier-protein] thioesterase [Treponema sp.]|nr:acyl-[acyl-carrier-protein] thioesterase [Treponema sp.]